METNLQSGNSYSDRIKFFINQKNLNNRELTKILGYKSEALVSRYVNSNDMSITFIVNLSNAFPDLDLNWLIKDNYTPITSYDLIAENAKLKKKIEDLTKILSQN
jgi:hypothetical protein